MGLINCRGMRALEEAAFRAGASAETLMNKAGRRLGETLAILHPEPGTAVAYVGRGNNGGDALVALQVLRAAGWRIAVRGACLPLELGLLPRRKLRELGEVELQLSGERGSFERVSMWGSGLFGGQKQDWHTAKRLLGSSSFLSSLMSLVTALRP